MSIEGSINVSALFHDRDGTTAMKVVSLRSSDEYTTGKVAIITGTAGSAALSITQDLAATSYRDASGSLVIFSAVQRAVFSWSGSVTKFCEFSTQEQQTVVLASFSSNAAASYLDPSNTISVNLLESDGAGTGTYTIVLYGV